MAYAARLTSKSDSSRQRQGDSLATREPKSVSPSRSGSVIGRLDGVFLCQALARRSLTAPRLVTNRAGQRISHAPR